jgi:hypothetical protein
MGEAYEKVSQDIEAAVQEVAKECNCFALYKKDFSQSFSFRHFIHAPFLPPLQQPGWLLEYLLGPFDEQWLENFYTDAQAGLTVLLTLVPQVYLIFLWWLILS